jgi:hypothetical protein
MLALSSAMNAATASWAGGVTVGAGIRGTLSELDVAADVVDDLVAGVVDAIGETAELAGVGAIDCRWVPLD